MSIPKDEIDKTSILTEPVNPTETSSIDGPPVIDGTGKEADPNFISPVQTDENQEIQVAGLGGKFGKKAGKVITDGVDAWTDFFGGTDVTQSPNQKKKVTATIKGDSPVATVDTEGTVVIRPMSME